MAGLTRHRFDHRTPMAGLTRHRFDHRTPMAGLTRHRLGRRTRLPRWDDPRRSLTGPARHSDTPGATSHTNSSGAFADARRGA
jgi:hypothetical protein